MNEVNENLVAESGESAPEATASVATQSYIREMKGVQVRGALGFQRACCWNTSVFTKDLSMKV